MRKGQNLSSYTVYVYILYWEDKKQLLSISSSNLFSTNITTWLLFKQKLDNPLSNQMLKNHTESLSKLQMTRPHSSGILI